jgi:hypothetical protein
MKFSIAGVLATIATGIAVFSAAQSTPPPAQPPATQPNPAQPTGKVIFSRSIDENGQTTTLVNIATPQTTVTKADKPVTTDPERQAVTFTAFDLDVRLRTVEQHIAVRAQITVRNDGKSPLARIPLQISSTLQWDRIRIANKDIPFSVALLKSDVDHTGQLNEAAVTLDQPLAPNATLLLDVTYSGDIPISAQRLAVIDTPEDVALHSDWDQISVSFTGLRGFGNVVWYPVSSVPAFLGEGARLFDQIGEHKLRLFGARFRLRLTVEFPHGQPPTVALVNGHPLTLAPTDRDTPSPDPDQAPTQEIPGIATADIGPTTLGFEAPSLFVAIRSAHSATNNTILWALPDDNPVLPSWAAAATAVTPFLQSWLGQTPRSQLNILDLPDPGDLPFETGALLATPIGDAPAEKLDTILVHALARAWIQPPVSPQPQLQPPAWLDEGLATFLGTLWVQRDHGREQALGTLEAARPALALAEPASPGESPGQPLTQAISPVYYRTKAAYVLWMIKESLGDAALSTALCACNPAEISDPDAIEPSLISLKNLLENPANPVDHRDLSWLFSDWVDADKGLPDLTISSVFPVSQPAGDWLVAVNIANTGYASAEVPVTVRSADKSVTRRLLVPARGKAVQRILIDGKPLEVQVNDGTVPEIQASVHVTTLGQPANNPDSSSQSNPPQP